MKALRWIGLALVSLAAVAILTPPASAQLNRISGNQIVGGTAKPSLMQVGDGSAAAPPMSFLNHPTDGFFYRATDVIGVAFLGSEYITMSAAALRFTGSLDINNSGDTILTRVAGPLANFNVGVKAPTFTPTSFIATAATSQAAGGTVNANSDFTRSRYQVTVAPAVGDCSTAFIAAALTADCTIATLPAGMKLVGVYADVTVGFACSGTCSGTKVMQAGTAAGGTQVLAAALNVAATGQFGLADADLGSGMTRAAAIQGGLIGSWSSTTPISVRFTSGTGNWGNAAATFVNAGSVKFTLITEQIK